MRMFSRDLNAVVNVTLLGGLMFSLLLLTISLAWQWFSSGVFGFFPAISAHNLLEYLTYILRNASYEKMGPATLAYAGIAVLLLTPFIRVLASMLYFGFREHNRIYTTITAFVLMVLGIVLFAV
jgi:uncharacterized membrane protein